jgi:hypothetical protein
MGRIVEVRLQFTDACATKPVFCRRQRELDVLPLVQDAVRVEDLRDHADGTALDIEGFVPGGTKPPWGDFLDPDERWRFYLPELEHLVPRLSGAARAIALGSGAARRTSDPRVLPRPERLRSGGSCTRITAPSSHGSRYWLDRILPTAEAALYSSRRYAIYNVWRVLSETAPGHFACALRSAQPERRRPSFRDCVNDHTDPRSNVLS